MVVLPEIQDRTVKALVVEVTTNTTARRVRAGKEIPAETEHVPEDSRAVAVAVLVLSVEMEVQVTAVQVAQEATVLFQVRPFVTPVAVAEEKERVAAVQQRAVVALHPRTRRASTAVQAQQTWVVAVVA